MTDLPQAIRDRREAFGLSLRDVADEAGVSFATVSRIERGMPATPRTAAKLQLWLDGLHGRVPTTDERIAKLERQVAQLLDMLLRHLANQGLG